MTLKLSCFGVNVGSFSGMTPKRPRCGLRKGSYGVFHLMRPG